MCPSDGYDRDRVPQTGASRQQTLTSPGSGGWTSDEASAWFLDSVFSLYLGPKEGLRLPGSLDKGTDPILGTLPS